jgi:hypothetical protein
MQRVKRTPSRALYHLASLDPWGLRLVYYRVRYRWFSWLVSEVPFPARLGIINAGVLFVLLLMMPPARQIPAVALPALWAASYCLALSVATAFPQKRKARI